MGFYNTCQRHQGLDRSTLHQVYYDLLLSELPKNGFKMAGTHVKKRIISVGFDIPGFDDCYSYKSSQSLLDADIVVFEPNLSYYTDSTYQSERCFDEDTSFLLKKDTVHWRSEILTAFQDGKTIFVFMGKYEKVFVHTGEKKFSGTGKNTRTTNIVSPYNNYEFLPIDIPPLIPREGSEITFSGNSLFAIFWDKFKEHIKYECYLNGKIDIPLFSTKTGNRPVGGLFHGEKGNLILLPPIRYPEEEFTEYNQEDRERYWTRKALTFGKQLLQILVDIDSALRSSAEASPPPSWVGENEYKLEPETELTRPIQLRSATPWLRFEFTESEVFLKRIVKTSMQR